MGQQLAFCGDRPKSRPAPARSPDVSAVRHLRLFDDLDLEAQADILRLARPQRLGPGEAPLRQGDAPDLVFLVLSGRFKAVQVTSEGAQVVTRLVGPGDLMGHVAVLNDKPHSETPIAVLESLVLAWNCDDFMEAMRRHPGFAVAVMRGMAASIQEAHTRLREAATERVEQRIAHAVLRLARQAGRRVANGVEIAFPLTRQDIALMTGATLHTVSRTLSAWEHQGLVDGGRQHLVLRAPWVLARIAGGAAGGEETIASAGRPSGE